MKFENGTAVVNIYDFVDSVYRTADEKTKRDICDSLACLDPVIDHVAAQIVDGFTEFVSHGPGDYPAQSEPGTALDRAQRAVAKGAGEVAKREIERLEAALDQVETRAVEAERQFECLLHHVSGDVPRSRSYYLRLVDAAVAKESA